MLKTDDANPAYLAAAPLSHAGGVFAFNMMALGSTVVVLPQFDVGDVIAAVQRHRVTHLWLPPTALYLLLDSPDAKSTDWSSLKRLVIGAAAVSTDKLREAVEVFGPCVCTNYSQIECGFLTWLEPRTLAAAAKGDHPERLSSSGTSLFVGRVGIMNDEGLLEPAGREGEIVVRGASVKNYMDDCDTAAARRHGWHQTGDLGFFDSDGYLYVSGRKKDIIISGGFKISAADIERAILELPQIRDCAAVAVPDRVRGESAVAVVSLKEGQPFDADAITAHCHARLGRHGGPRFVQHWPELPRTAVGKVDKLLIRDTLSKEALPSAS
jgi:acyl-CoA synthetase (AMP-forming)/AMP-acid ligase II